MDLLAGLDPSQREAVTVPGGPLCILAPAGSGKTRVLTRRVAHRIAEGDAEPEHTLVLTFTRKAANELTARLRSLGVRDRVTAGTFHAVAWSVLRQGWCDEGRSAPGLLDHKARLLGPLLGTARRSRRTGSAVGPGEIATEIEWAKARLIGPDRYEGEALAADRRPPLPVDQVAELYRQYEEAKRRQRLVDFDDLLLLCAGAIERHPETAAAQRWRFRHLFVDEFQDVNPAQHRLLEAWRGGRPDLCVVGDPNQAIYGWNGADPAFLSDVGRFFPGTAVVRLTSNYRSSPQILAAAHAVLATTGIATPPPTATRPEGPPVRIHGFDDEAAEASGVAALLRDRRGVDRSWRQLAVLARTNAQLVVIERALRSIGIPCRVRGSAALLDQPAVAAWRRSLTSQRDLALTVALADLDEQLRAVDDDGVDGERSGPLATLLTLGHELLAEEPGATVGAFVAWLLAGQQGGEPDRDEPAVELATFHAAKGLEWPVVVIAGAEQGYAPMSGAKGAARLEEVRLFYVALTRASAEVHVTWARRRTLGERVLERTPSPFLAAVESTGRDDEALPVDQLARVKAARRRVDTTDDPVLTRLLAWRATTARAASVPASVVFDDTTLAAVATIRPRTLAELHRIPGIAPVKAARYGEQLLALVGDG